MSEHLFDPAVLSRWNELADRARALIEAEHGKSVSAPWPKELPESIYALQAAIAETEEPAVAEWAVSRWFHLRYCESIADSVLAEREDTPLRLAARAERERHLAQVRASLPGPVRPAE